MRKSRSSFLALSIGSLAQITSVAHAAPVLQTHADSLTDYRAGASTSVQGVWPRVEQRGTNLDGGMRVQGALPWSAAGNPFADGWNSARNLNGIDLATGSYAPTEIDLSLPSAGVRWTIGRSYNARQWDASGAAYHQNNGYQGRNWMQLSQPEIRFYDTTGDSNDVVYIVYGADRYLQFSREGSGNVFRGTNGAGGLVQYVSGSPDTWVYYDQHGTKTTFFGGNTSSNRANWQLWKIADPAGNTAYVGHATTASTAVTDGYESDGRIKLAYDPAGRRYTYTYTSVDSVNRLTQVIAEVNSGSWTMVGKVEYGYYSNADATYGDSGNLKWVKVTTPLTDSGVNSVKTKLYRYWKGTFNASTNPGHPYAIQYVVDYEGYRRGDWAGDSSFDDDPFTMSEGSLKPYAGSYFEYDSERRVSKTWNNGQCGCSGATNGQHEITYGINGSFSNTSGYDTAWKSRAVVKRPDGSYITQYFDETGQALSRVVSDADPAVGTPTFWVTAVDRSIASSDPADGVVKTTVMPSAGQTYTHSTGAITSESAVGQALPRTQISTSTIDKGFDKKRLTRNGKGTAETATAISENAYGSVTTAIGGVDLVRPVVSSRTDYRAAGEMSPVTTSTSRTWHSGDAVLMPKVVTTSNPIVDTANNGSGSATTNKQFLRTDGSQAFTESADGIVSYAQFTNGQIVKRIQDAQTNHATDFASGDDPNTNFGMTETGSGLRIITTYTYDAQGRLDTSTLPDGRTTKMYYSKLADGRLVTISIPNVTAGPTYAGPASYSVSNLAGQAEASGTIALSGGSTASALSAWINESSSDPIAAITASGASLKRLSTSIYNESGGQLTESRSYFLIPASGAGTSGTNFDVTTYGYDTMGRKWRTKSAAGSVERSVFDAQGRVSARWTGTNDNSFTGGEASGPDNMVKVEAMEYDADSRVTKRTLYVQDSTTGQRVTEYKYDFRGRLIAQINPTAPHSVSAYDNLGRVIATASYATSAGLESRDVTNNDDSAKYADRLSLTESFYDELGRTWKTKRYKVSSTGAWTDSLDSLSWFDSAGRLIKTVGESHTKTFYDRLGRQTHRFTLANNNDTAYADASNLTNDIVLEESQTAYEAATGRVLMRATISRYHSDKGGGATTGALDTNADNDALKLTAGDLKGRAQISATWYDTLGRVTDTADYGTNGGTILDRTGLAVPSRSDTVLVTTYAYNDDGSRRDVTDPRGIIGRTLYDDAGRTTATIANYVDGTPSGTTAADDNYVRFTYSAGRKTEQWVDLDGDGVKDPGDQVTTYTYGVTKGAAAGDSKISRNDMLWKVQYPDSSGGTDVVTNAYNAQGELIWTKDQAGNIVETDFDTAGRTLHRRVTTLASGFDGAVRRITTSYDSRGRTTNVTQYDNATAGSGSVVNDVAYAYDDWGNISKFAQDRDSLVGSGTPNDYNLAYTYAKSSGDARRNTVRRTEAKVRYASTDLQAVTYEYLSSSSYDDDASRVSRVKVGAVAVAAYDYLGDSRVVGVDYPEIDVMSLQYGTTSGSFPDLDRFNRPITSRWTKDLTTDRDFYNIAVTWDRGSNVTSVDDQIWPSRDASYTVDGLSRLTQAEEGTWNGSAITSRARDEQWTLTRTGNWNRNKLDLNGDGDFTDAGEQDDTQAFNDANELLTRDTDSNAVVDLTLGHDAVGNLTDDGNALKYDYDAFGRMVRVKDRSSPFATIAEYVYNGLGHRISWRYDANADSVTNASDPWYHFAYDESWRVVALYRGADTSPKEIFTNHQPGRNGVRGASGLAAGLDAVILRYKDANSVWTAACDATREERVYYCQNWRGDVVALLGASAGDFGVIRERVTYSAYGVPQGLPPGDLDNDADSDAADETLWNTLSSGAYDVRADLDLDGDMDITDEGLITGAVNQGFVMGRGVLTRDNGLDYAVGNRKGYAGYEHDGVFNTLCHVRHRLLLTELGRWSRRDPLGYVDGMGLYAYTAGQPITAVDVFGLQSEPLTQPTSPYTIDPPLLPDYTLPKPRFRGIRGVCYTVEFCDLETQVTELYNVPTSPSGSGSSFPGNCQGSCGVYPRVRRCTQNVCYRTTSCGSYGFSTRTVVADHGCVEANGDDLELGTIRPSPACGGRCACITPNRLACYE